MKTKKSYMIPSIKVIRIDSSDILLDASKDPYAPVNLSLDLDEEEEGYAD